MPFTDSSSCNQSVRFRMHAVDEDLFPEQIFTFRYGEETCLYCRKRLWLLSWTWVWILTLWPWATLWSFKFFLHRWSVGVHVSIFRVKTPARGWSSAKVGNCGRVEVDVCALVQCYIRLWTRYPSIVGGAVTWRLLTVGSRVFAHASISSGMREVFPNLSC